MRRSEKALFLTSLAFAVAACHPRGATEEVCADGRFLVRARTVRDTKTGFIWQRQPVPEKMDWDHADRYCRSIGMRLPSSLMLAELMKTGAAGKRALDECAFPGQSADPETVEDGSDNYWSATSQGLLLGRNVDRAQTSKVCVYGLGELCHDAKTTSHRVRCVRQ